MELLNVLNGKLDVTTVLDMGYETSLATRFRAAASYKYFRAHAPDLTAWSSTKLEEEYWLLEEEHRRLTDLKYGGFWKEELRRQEEYKQRQLLKQRRLVEEECRLVEEEIRLHGSLIGTFSRLCSRLFEQDLTQLLEEIEDRLSEKRLLFASPFQHENCLLGKSTEISDEMHKFRRPRNMLFEGDYGLEKDVLLYESELRLRTLQKRRHSDIYHNTALLEMHIQRIARILQTVKDTLYMKAILSSLTCIRFLELLYYALAGSSVRPRRFPGKRRPPSPSWPWNVKTSLVVLWGVCWMFYDHPQANDDFDFNAYIQGFGDPLYDWLGPIAATNTGPVMPAGETDMASQNYLDRPLVTMAQPYDSNSSQNESLQSGPYQANTTLHFIPLQRSICSHSTALDADYTLAPKTGHEGLEKLTDKASISPVDESLNEGAVSSSSRPDEIMNSESLNQSGDLSQDEFDKSYCKHINCAPNPPTFRRESDWNKHMARHERPFICRSSGCESVPGFTCQGDLKRHEQEQHNKGKKFLCPFTDCKRNLKDLGFTRRTNLADHVRRVHKTSDMKAGEGREQSAEDRSDNGNSRSNMQSSSSRQQPQHLITRSTEYEDEEALQLQHSQPQSPPLHNSVPYDQVPAPKRRRGNNTEMMDNARHLPTANTTTGHESQEAEIQRLRREVVDKNVQIADKDAQIVLLKDWLDNVLKQGNRPER